MDKFIKQAKGWKMKYRRQSQDHKRVRENNSSNISINILEAKKFQNWKIVYKQSGHRDTFNTSIESKRRGRNITQRSLSNYKNYSYDSAQFRPFKKLKNKLHGITTKKE
mmetsp:Transcript_17409/g.15348  ORF Transcript_17409/g.15348 Transcript_17409/m.15348 type:complete len:109 (-) Transcript_17409:22-348(-)